MMSYRNALVLGLGDSGEAAAELLLAEGCEVTAVDAGDSPALQERKKRLESRRCRVALGVKELPPGDFDLCVVSPGIPSASTWIGELTRRGVPVIPELELGWSRCKCRVAAITGSNGKSTAVKLLAESLRAAGLRAEPGGNYGPPLARLASASADLDWIVAEVSTFQMETAREFRPDIGILLNVYPNHLDRHGDMRTYFGLKARLFARTRPEDVRVVHQPLLAGVRETLPELGRWVTFDLSPAGDYRYRLGGVYKGEARLADLSRTHFANDVLGLAATGVAAALDCAGMDAAALEKAARDFKSLPHRMQTVGQIRGVRYVNDSKATNLAAMSAGVSMTSGKIRLIAGGLVKEKDLSFVKELLAKRVTGVYLIGKASELMASAWSDVVPCFLCETLDVAVRKAGDDAGPGDVVLLSPACASFDQFRNYEERGERFAQLVARLSEEV